MISTVGLVKRIHRCVGVVLAHQRSNNRVDVGLILQRVDHKFNRPFMKKDTNVKEYIKNSRANLSWASKYLEEKHNFPPMGDAVLDTMVGTKEIQLHYREIGYTQMEWSFEEVKMKQVKKFKPSWSMARIEWDDSIHYLPHIFDCDSKAHQWLDFHYYYVPRVSMGL